LLLSWVNLIVTNRYKYSDKNNWIFVVVLDEWIGKVYFIFEDDSKGRWSSPQKIMQVKDIVGKNRFLQKASKY
jgi:hypothetical protein